MRFSVKRTDNDKDMIEEYQLRVLPETAANEQALRRYVAREKGKDERTLTAIRVLKRSIDARQRTIFVNLKLRVYVNEQPEETRASEEEISGIITELREHRVTQLTVDEAQNWVTLAVEALRPLKAGPAKNALERFAAEVVSRDR